MSRKKRRKGRCPVLRPFDHGSLHVWESIKVDDDAEPDMIKLKPGAIDVYRGRNNIETAHTLSHGKQRGRIEGMAMKEIFIEQILQRRFNPRAASDAMDVLTDDDKFTMIHVPFVMGRSFMPEFRVAIYSVMYHSTAVMVDGYLAFLGLVAHCQASRLPLANPDLRGGARALQMLRSVKIVRPQDALCALLLGQALFVFEVLTDSFTTSAHSIVQSALISAQPWYQALSGVPAFDTITLCPVLLDIVGCLVYRRVPIIQLHAPERIIVDRYLGLLSTLLPSLAILCEQSQAAKSKANNLQLRVADQEPQADCYTRIESVIEAWVQRIPPDFLTTYDKAEREMMMTQARVYRLAALLIIHRLRFPLGVQDALGHCYAHRIFDEIRSLFALSDTQGAGAAFPISFPLFLSMLEVEGPGEDLMESLRRFPIQSVCMVKLHEFVRHVRTMKESGYCGLWFDLVESGLTYAVIP